MSEHMLSLRWGIGFQAEVGTSHRVCYSPGRASEPEISGLEGRIGVIHSSVYTLSKNAGFE